MAEPWPYVRATKHGDVHRKWVETGWFRVFQEDAREHAEYKKRKQREALERQHRERAAALARKRALGVQSMRLAW